MQITAKATRERYLHNNPVRRHHHRHRHDICCQQHQQASALVGMGDHAQAAEVLKHRGLWLNGLSKVEYDAMQTQLDAIEKTLSVTRDAKAEQMKQKLQEDEERKSTENVKPSYISMPTTFDMSQFSSTTPSASSTSFDDMPVRSQVATPFMDTSLYTRRHKCTQPVCSHIHTCAVGTVR